MPTDDVVRLANLSGEVDRRKPSAGTKKRGLEAPAFEWRGLKVENNSDARAIVSRRASSVPSVHVVAARVAMSVATVSVAMAMAMSADRAATA